MIRWRRLLGAGAVLAAALAGATPVSAQSGCVVEITPSTIVVESGDADTQTVTVTGRGFPADAPLTLDFHPVGSIMDFRTDASGDVSQVIDVRPESVYVPDDPDAADYLLVATAWEGDEPPHLQPTLPDRLCEAEAPYVVVAGEAGTIPDTATTHVGSGAVVLAGLIAVLCLALLAAVRSSPPPVR